MSAASIIAKYGKTVTLSRESSSGSIGSDGGFTRGSSAPPSSIVMSIQPMSGDEALRLPEGIRNKKVMKGYTTTDITNGSQSARKIPDLIIDGSTTYEINDVQYYEANTLSIAPHYRCTLVRVNPT